MVYKYFILQVFFLLFAVEAFQINMNPSYHNNPISKDTLQAHYENMMDDILGQQNEKLLGELSVIIKDPHNVIAMLRPEAEYIVGSKDSSLIPDICISQLPGMIANQIHELSNQLYQNIEQVISKYWLISDTELRQLILNIVNLKGYNEQEIIDELVSLLELVNLDISDTIIHNFDGFNMISKLRDNLKSCQASTEPLLRQTRISEDETVAFKEKLWHSLLSSLYIEDEGMENLTSGGFMNSYTIELKSIIQTELYSTLFELARKVYEDLAFSN